MARVAHNKGTTESFVLKAIVRHGFLYDYSFVQYLNAHTKVDIFCKKSNHGIFSQIANDHLSGAGCPKCKSEIISLVGKNNSLTHDEFIDKAMTIHSDRYDYTVTRYVSMRKKIEIKCRMHGIFKQLPHAHLQGQGCKACFEDKQKNSDFIVMKSEKALKSSHRVKKFQLPSGKIINLQGGESFVLNNLLQTYPEDKVSNGFRQVPAIEYIDVDGKDRKYYPDFYIESENLIIEVKSSFTYDRHKKNTDLKLEACERQGYKTRLIIENRRSKDFTIFIKE